MKIITLCCVTAMAGTLGVCQAEMEVQPDTLRPDPQRMTLPLPWREQCEGVMRFYGFSSLWWGNAEERAARVARLRADHSNSQGCNFTWLSGVMKPTSGTLGVGIDEQHGNFKEFPAVLQEAERNQYPLFVGNISCTNFHEFPDWYLKLNPTLYVTTAQHSPTTLNYEKQVAAKQQRGWSAIDNAHLNAIKREFVNVVLRHFGNHPAIKAWCMDGESLYPPNRPQNDLADYGIEALRHYQAWLERKYETISALNTAWGTTHTAFAVIQPPREKIGDAANVDWHRFRCEAMAEYVQQFYVLYKAGAATKPALAWQHDVQFRDFERMVTGQCVADYARVGDGIQANPIIRPPRLDYNILYFRAMTSFNKPVISKEASYYPRPWPAENVRMQLFEMLGMGLWATQLCEWEWLSEGIDWGIKGTAGEQAAKEVFGLLTDSRQALQGMWPVMPTARVYISDAKWLMDGWQPTWNQLQYDLISSQQPNLYLFDWQLEQPIYWSPMIISVANSVVDQRAAKALERYVRAGGTLALIDEFQTYDERIAASKSFLNQLGDGIHQVGSGKVMRIRRPYSAAAFNLLLDVLKFGKITPWVRLAEGSEPERTGIELFPLTNQHDHAVVAVNTNTTSTSMALEFDPLLLGSGEYRVSVASTLSHKNHSGWGDEAGSVNAKHNRVPGKLTLAPLDGTIIFLRNLAPKTNDNRKLVLHIDPEGPVRWRARLKNQTDNAVDATFSAQLVPLFDAPAEVTRIAVGDYRIQLPATLPTVYDYSAAKYRTFTGPMQLRVYAYSSAGEAHATIQIPAGEAR